MINGLHYILAFSFAYQRSTQQEIRGGRQRILLDHPPGRLAVPFNLRLLTAQQSLHRRLGKGRGSLHPSPWAEGTQAHGSEHTALAGLVLFPIPSALLRTVRLHS